MFPLVRLRKETRVINFSRALTWCVDKANAKPKIDVLIAICKLHANSMQ